MTAWLVTGGAGFIGSNFVRMAAEQPVDVIVVFDALTYAGNLNNIADVVDDRRVAFCKGDICDFDLLQELFRRYSFDCVIHFAAETHVDRSILGSHPFIRTNIEGTHNLVEAARLAWKESSRGKLFVHVSTDEVFGDLAANDAPVVEGTPYRPSSPYAASKAAADHLVRAWQRTYGLPVIVTNCGNNYGPWQFPEKFIPLMILNAVENRELPIYGDGLQIRDWLHVWDHCRAILSIIAKGDPGQTYLIGADNPKTNLEVVRMVCAAVDAEIGRSRGQTAKLIRYVPDRPGHDRRYALNASFARGALGWRPTEMFESAIPALVRWYIEHKQWADLVRTGAYAQYYQQQYRDRR